MELLFFYLLTASTYFCVFILRECSADSGVQMCEVCSGTLGYAGTVYSVHSGDSAIRCTLRCHSDSACHMASYDDTTRTCSLLQNVIQNCNATKTGRQFMNPNNTVQNDYSLSSHPYSYIIQNEAEIAPITESPIFDINSTTTDPGSSSTTDSSTESTSYLPTTSPSTDSTDSTSPSPTSPQTLQSFSVSTSPSPTSQQTTQSASISSGWVETLSYNSSQNATQMFEINNIISNVMNGIGVRLIYQTSDDKISLGTDWAFSRPDTTNICFQTYGSYIHSDYTLKKAYKRICAASDSLTEYAWPSSNVGTAGLTMVTPLEKVSIFCPTDQSGFKYAYTDWKITDADLKQLANRIRIGYTVKVIVNSNEIFSADIAHFVSGNTALYIMARNYMMEQPLTFSYRLYDVGQSKTNLQPLNNGDFVEDWEDASNNDTQFLLVEKWTKVFQVDSGGNTTYGSYSDLVGNVTAGHRVKITTANMSFIADTVVHVPAQDTILAVIVEEYWQENGGFRCAEVDIYIYCKVWRFVRTDGSVTVVKFDDMHTFIEETNSLASVTWFVDLVQWSEDAETQSTAVAIDTSTLETALEQGSSLRLKYIYSGVDFYLGTRSVNLEVGSVTAMTTMHLLVDYTATPIYSSTSHYIWWEMCTDGNNRLFNKNAATGSQNAYNFPGVYRVTWFTG